MKNAAANVLIAKLSFLICTTCVSWFGSTGFAYAQTLAPCHQQATMQADQPQEPCEMCELSLDTWSVEAIAAVNSSETPQTEGFNLDCTLPRNFGFHPEITSRLPLTYSPPPEAARKAVAPITKTIVLLI